jgi:ATP-dependent helicase/DNAse subunit B
MLSLTGRIDRADLLTAGDGHTYVRIIDYKSGRARFDPEEVRRGTQLQLMLYMNALMGSDRLRPLNPRPGGVFYFPIDDPLLKTDRLLTEAEREAGLLKSFALSGLDFTQDPDAFDRLGSEAEHTIKELGLRLTQGDITPAPYKRGRKCVCDYCGHDAVCKKNVLEAML